MSQLPIVTGISDHYGRAELVTLAREGRSSRVLDRRTVRLVDPGLPSAPYHHEGVTLPLGEAEPIIERTRASVLAHARAALAEIQAALGVGAVVLQASPFPELPESVASILASKRMTNAADGMLYREALASQAEEVGLVVHRFPRGADPVGLAAQALGCPEADINRLLDAFRKSVGRPWRKDHERAAAAAVWVLGGNVGTAG